MDTKWKKWTARIAVKIICFILILALGIVMLNRLFALGIRSVETSVSPEVILADLSTNEYFNNLYMDNAIFRATQLFAYKSEESIRKSEHLEWVQTNYLSEYWSGEDFKQSYDYELRDLYNGITYANMNAGNDTKENRARLELAAIQDQLNSFRAFQEYLRSIKGLMYYISDEAGNLVSSSAIVMPDINDFRSQPVYYIIDGDISESSHSSNNGSAYPYSLSKYIYPHRADIPEVSAPIPHPPSPGLRNPPNSTDEVVIVVTPTQQIYDSDLSDITGENTPIPQTYDSDLPNSTDKSVTIERNNLDIWKNNAKIYIAFTSDFVNSQNNVFAVARTGYIQDISIIVVSAILAIILFVILMLGAGRKYSKSKPTHDTEDLSVPVTQSLQNEHMQNSKNPFSLGVNQLQNEPTRNIRSRAGNNVSFMLIDKPYLDIGSAAVVGWTALIVYLASGLYSTFWRNNNISAINLLLALLPVLVGIPVLLWFMSFAKRIKAGRFWRHTLIYAFPSKLFRYCVRLLKSLWAGAKLTKKVGLIAFTSFCVMLIVGLAGTVSRGLPVLPAALILTTAVTFFLLRYARRIDKLEKSAQDASRGTYDVPTIDVGGGELGSIANSINNISAGINAAVEQRMKSERLKTELITNVSHDIRTPLTSIITYTDLLKHEGLDCDKAPEYLDILIQKSQRLKTLTDELFEAAKAVTGNIEVNITQLDIVALINQVLGELDGAIKMSGLDLRVNLPERLLVNADGKLMWRVMENLLSNVFKYSLPSSRVYLSAVTTAAGDVERMHGAVKGAQGDKNWTQGDKSGTQGDINGTQGDKSGTQGDINRTQGVKNHTQVDIIGAQGDIKGKLEGTKWVSGDGSSYATQWNGSNDSYNAREISLRYDFVRIELKNISATELNIDPSELTERFKRGDNSRSDGGNGLGLSIVQSFVNAQGGKFAISIDGDLFKVSVYLPVSC